MFCLKISLIFLFFSFKVKELNVNGGSDYNGCKSLVEKLVNAETCKNMEFKKCLEPTDLAKTNRKFMVNIFSITFFFITNDLMHNDFFLL